MDENDVLIDSLLAEVYEDYATFGDAVLGAPVTLVEVGLDILHPMSLYGLEGRIDIQVRAIILVRRLLYESSVYQALTGSVVALSSFGSNRADVEPGWLSRVPEQHRRSLTPSTVRSTTMHSSALVGYHTHPLSTKSLYP